MPVSITLKMNVYTLIIFLITTLQNTNAGLGGFGIRVKDLECDELLADPKYQGKRCTIRDLTTKRTSYNWYKLTHPEIVFINATMPYIPLDLQMEMELFEMINLTDANLQFIDKGHFELASQLSQLYLAGNLLYNIPTKIFVGAPALQILDLSRNEIEKIDTGAFNGLKSLLQLDLSGNDIREIVFSTFSDLVQLKHLNLGYNAFTEIDVADIKEHLPNLEWIGLKGSKIDCSEIRLIGQKLRDASVFTDVIDDLSGEVSLDADCIKPPMAEMWFD